jgi:hypothetical protein
MATTMLPTTEQRTDCLTTEQLELLEMGTVVHSLAGPFKRVPCKTWADSNGGWRPCHYSTGRVVARSSIRPSCQLATLGVSLR